MDGKDTPKTTFLLTAGRDFPTYAGTNIRKQNFSVRNVVQCPVLSNFLSYGSTTLYAASKSHSPQAWARLPGSQRHIIAASSHHHLHAHGDMAPPTPRLFVASPYPPHKPSHNHTCTLTITGLPNSGCSRWNTSHRDLWDSLRFPSLPIPLLLFTF